MILSLSQTVKLLFLVAVFLCAFEQAFLFFFGFDSTLKAYRIVLLMAMALLPFTRFRMAPYAFKVFGTFVALYALGFAIALFWSITGAVSLGTLGNQMILLFIAFCFFTLALLCIETPEQLDRIVHLILISAILSTGIWYASNYSTSFYRATGFFRNPNHFAYMLALSILFALYEISRGDGRTWITVTLVLFIPFCVFMLLLSGSRSVLLTLAPCLIFFVFRFVTLPERGSSRRIIAGLVGIVSLVVIVIAAVNSSILSERLLDRFSSANVSSGSGRLDLWKSGFLAAEDYNYSGLGLGQYVHQHSYYIRQVSGSVYNTVLEFDLGLHSEYMNLLTEFGVIGLLLYIWVIAMLWRVNRRFWWRCPEWRHLANLLESLLLFDILFSASQDMYTFPYHWIVLGLCASLIKAQHTVELRDLSIPLLAGVFRTARVGALT